jgi:hypothetical protein
MQKMIKITRSKLNNIISEEVERIKKIKELNERKISIQKELNLLNEFTVVSPGDKESLKSLSQNGRPYLNSLNTLAKKYPDSKFQKLIQKFVMLHKEAESVLADMALKGEAKPNDIGQSPAMPEARVNPVPVAAPASEEEIMEGDGVSLTNKQGQNAKPNTPHKKVRAGVKK